MLVHDPSDKLVLVAGHMVHPNIPLVLVHGSVRVVEVEIVGEVVLSAHGLREAVRDVDLLAGLSHGGHCRGWFDVEM